MGDAYVGLLADRSLLRMQLHAHAACDEDVVRAQVHRACERLVELIERESAASTTQVRRFCADAQLLNVISTIEAEGCAAHWAQLLLDDRLPVETAIHAADCTAHLQQTPSR